MLDIHVISLENARDRRERARKQLDDMHVPFQFFDALDGDAGRSLFAAVDERQFVLHTGREVTAGEIGCFASHKALWQRCVEQGTPLIVMEDDFSLAPFFAKALAVTEPLVEAVGLLRLQDERRACSMPVAPVGAFVLERYTKMPHCTMCYAIAPRIAARLLEINDNFVAPVDVVMKLVWTFDNPMYCLTPYAVSDSELCYDSIIGNRAKCSKHLRTRLRRVALKIHWQWQRIRFNLRQSDTELAALCAGLELSDSPAWSSKGTPVPG